MADLYIRESYLLDFLILEQIIRTSGALETGSENEHTHFKNVSEE
jgi:hypothetical protein